MILHRISALLFLLVAAASLFSALVLAPHLSLWPNIGNNLLPMPLNLAILLFLLALSLLLMQWGNTVLIFATSLMSSGIGLLLFVEFISHENIGAGEMFLGNPLDSQAPLSEMAAGTSLAILMMGIAAFFLGKVRRRRLLLLIPALAAVLVICCSSFDALAGFLDLPFLSDTAGNRTESILFILLAIGVLLLAAAEILGKASSLEALQPVFGGGILLLLTVLIWHFSIQIDVGSVRNKLLEVAQQEAIALLDHLAIDSRLARKLSAQFPLQEGPAKEIWLENAKDAAKEMGGVIKIEVWDKQKNLLWEVPLKRGKTDSQGPLAIQETRSTLLGAAILSKRIQFSKVVPLARDVSVFMIAAPVMAADEVEKILLTTVQLDAFVAPFGPGEGFQFELIQNGKPVFSTGEIAKGMAADSWRASVHVPSPKVNWSVRLLPTMNGLLALEGEFPAIFLVLGILLGAIVALALHFKVLGRDNLSKIFFLESKFKATADLMPFAIWSSDAKGDLQSVNTIWINLTGLEEEASLGQGWLAAVHLDDKKGVQAAWAKGIKAGKSFVIDFSAVTKEGGACSVSCSMVPLKWGKQVYEFVGAIVEKPAEDAQTDASTL